MELNTACPIAKRKPTRVDSLRKKWLLQRRQQSQDDYGLSSMLEENEFSKVLPENTFYRQRLNKLNIRPSFTRSFDSERRDSNELQNPSGVDGRWSNLVLHHVPDRRSSFLYRLETDDCHSVYSSRHASITGDDILSE
ncbi:hypothetical protein FBUS_03996 [Fasciolopsis buskii]|uniref:Uncharacterized protein n=1 Tax=Fasciolopsis buskii TaxID=27845 RepID=A0A8E0VGN9_9TREM|nr:hypothetical protein FBUS_03996 [Fasciolopsis buski]